MNTLSQFAVYTAIVLTVVLSLVTYDCFFVKRQIAKGFIFLGFTGTSTALSVLGSIITVC